MNYSIQVREPIHEEGDWAILVKRGQVSPGQTRYSRSVTVIPSAVTSGKRNLLRHTTDYYRALRSTL
jgi:hypothetical protein